MYKCIYIVYNYIRLSMGMINAKVRGFSSAQRLLHHKWWANW